MKTRKTGIILLVAAFLPFGINAWTTNGLSQQEAYQVLLDNWNVENYPRILQLNLNQDDLIQGRINIEAEIEKQIAAQTRKIFSQGIVKFEKPGMLFEKPTGSRSVAIVGIWGNESWTTQHAEIMISFYRSIGIGNEDIYVLGNRNGYSTVGETGIAPVGPFTKQGYIDLVKELAANPEIKRAYLSVHTHGGSYVARNGTHNNQGGYYTTTPFAFDPTNPAHWKFKPAGYESQFEIGILRAYNFYNVLKLGDEKFEMISATPLPPGSLVTRVKIWIEKFVIDSDFHSNYNGQLVAKISRHKYYFSFCDENGECDWSDIILDPTAGCWQVDTDYLNPYPNEIESISADFDRNGIADIPFAMIISSGDTVMCVRMNVGNSYGYLSLTSDGMDLNGDGYIGNYPGEWLDINRNGQDDQLIIPTVFKLADGTLMTDIEFQQIFQQFNAGVKIIGIFHFCHSGGLLNYLPGPNAIFVASVEQFIFSSAGIYPLVAFKLAVDSLARDKSEIKFSEVMNFILDVDYTVYNHYNIPEYILLSDNYELPATPGPWPNNGQGYLAEKFIIIANQISPVVEDGPEIPYEFILSQNYPNPFNPSTTITYTLPKPGHVSLKVYNLLGQEVICLVDEYQLQAYHQIIFDGSHLSSGTYIYVLEAGGYVFTHKMILTK